MNDVKSQIKKKIKKNFTSMENEKMQMSFE